MKVKSEQRVVFISRYNKKAQMPQLIFGVVIVVILAIVVLAISYASSQINTAIQGESDMSVEAKAIMQENTNTFPSVFDAGISLMLVAVFMICLAMAYNAQGNPMFLIIALLVVSAIGFVAMLLSNTWFEVSNEPELVSLASNLPMTSFLINHYLAVTLVIAFSTIMVYIYRGQ